MSAAFDAGVHAVDEQVRALLPRSAVPGAAVAIFHRGERWSQGFGVTRVDRPQEVTSDTIFQIASATKCFTTLASFRLAEQGALELDAPIGRYLPAFSLRDPAHARAMTLRHVLNHRAGIEGDFCVDSGEGPDALARAVERLPEAELVHAPGAMFSYCNASFYLAGRIIEVLAGLPYETAIARWILDPLHMTRSFFSAEDVVAHRFAAGHAVTARGLELVERWSAPRAANPIVGLACSVDDLLRFAVAHLGAAGAAGEPALLSSEALHELLSVSTDAATGLAHAHGWAADSNGVLSAGGNMPQQVSRLAIVPRERFAVVVLANSTAGGTFAEAIQRHALRQLCGIEPEAAVRTPAGAALAAEACGRYVNPTSDIAIEQDGGQLFARVTFKRGGFPYEIVHQHVEWPRVPLALYESGRFALLPETQLERWGRVVRSGGDAIDHVLVHGRCHRRT